MQPRSSTMHGLSSNGKRGSAECANDARVKWQMVHPANSNADDNRTEQRKGRYKPQGVYAGEHRIVFARHRDQPHCCTVRMSEGR